MTRQQFAQQRGTTYTPPVSGVAEADRRAAEIIKQNAANVDDTAGNAIKQNADKVDDIAKNFNWKKFGKWGAIAAAAVTVGAILYKECNNKNNASTTEEVNKPDSTDKNTSTTNKTPAQQPTTAPATTADTTATDTTLVQQTVVPATPADTTATDTTLVQQTATAPATTATQEEAVTEVDSTQSSDKTTVSDSPIDADGKSVVKKGDGLWNIAERCLEYQLKNEPDKFANLSKNDRDKMIWKEVHRIADLNGFKLVTKIVNGIEIWVTAPMIHAGQKIQVVKKMDIAA